MTQNLALAVALALLPSCEVEVKEPAPQRFAVNTLTSASASARIDAPIPDRPATGTIHGHPFVPEGATLKEGILTLRSGEDFFPDLHVMLFLFLEDDTVVPEGRTWDVACQGGWRAGVPHVHVAWREPGERMPEYASATCGFRLRLELGRETAEETIPGRIELDAPGLGTRLVGTFDAAIEGFRLKDGEVDLSKDDLDVAHHVAAIWLAEESGGPIEVEDHALAWLHTEKPEGRPQVGYSVYWWRPEAGGELRATKLQFEKQEGAWTVSRALSPWQVAHRTRSHREATSRSPSSTAQPPGSSASIARLVARCPSSSPRCAPATTRRSGSPK